MGPDSRLENTRRQALETLAQTQAAAEASRREARLQAELEVLLDETASPDVAQVTGRKRGRRLPKLFWTTEVWSVESGETRGPGV